jgi:uncharacterized membrane protein YkvA (DUF1232 family)
MGSNAFFNIALGQAGRLLGRKRRMLTLLFRLGVKMKDVDWNQLKGNSEVKQRLLAMTRLFRAYAFGHYRAVPWKTLLMMTAAVIYFVTPVDLVPDLLLGVGFTDDFGILLMVYNAVHIEIDKFLQWERSHSVEA